MSDIDALVEFEPGSVPGLEFFQIESELSDLVGRKVDLNTARFLSSHFRHQIMEEAEIAYAAS